MRVRWTAQHSGEPVDGTAAAALICDRLTVRSHATWFASKDGRTLAVVTNGERAMVMLLGADGDAGAHAIDGSAGAESSDGYLLENGQEDTYPDRDTVPLPHALAHVADIIANRPLDPAGWCQDG
jgi:hypothetical protein